MNANPNNAKLPDKDTSPKITRVLISEIELLLSEKRTALSVMRTGIAVFALPLSVLSVLIATSKYYNPAQVIYLLIPLLLLCTGLIALGISLIIRAQRRLRVLDLAINGIKQKSPRIAKLIT